MKMTQPVRKKQQVQQLIAYYNERKEFRNHLLVVIGIFSALRISDILCLTWNDVYDFKRKTVRKEFTLTEKKTGKCKTIILHKKLIRAVEMYAKQTEPASGKFLFSNKRTGKAISRVQAYRIIRAAAEALDFTERVSCHSLRKTFGYHAWKNGASPVVLMEIYNHNSFAVTRRYLGVAQDDKNAVYIGLDFAG